MAYWTGQIYAEQPPTQRVPLFGIRVDVRYQRCGVLPLTCTRQRRLAPGLALTSLKDNFKALREITDKFQQELIAERKTGKAPAESRNEYQPGDLVLYNSLHDDKARRSAKLDSRYKGPYEVLRQVKDEVEGRHLALGSIKLLLVERLKIFVGSKDDAFKLAMEDADQFLVDRITAWKGNPALRTEMEFEVVFSDGDVVWKRWD